MTYEYIRMAYHYTRVHACDIQMTQDYIMVAYEWHTSTYRRNTSTYEWHTNGMRVTYEYIQLTYKLLTTGMRITQEILNRKNVFGAFRS